MVTVVGNASGSGSMGLKSSGYLRGLMTSAALAAVVALAGCETDGLQSRPGDERALGRNCAPSSRRRTCRSSRRCWCGCSSRKPNSNCGSRTRRGRYELLKTYPICRWSGELGPKIKEGDRQAPEGFYTITPAQMNPNSQFYLSFNMGYPNAFDKAHGRTGAHLMVHGDCSSRGCYAMTDDQIGEIYALARESFFGGQRAFQVQAYPFRMTAANFAKHRNNPNIPFWRMLKEGNDHFEITQQEPVVEVCDKRYVFNPQAPQNFTPVSNGIKLGTPWGGFRDQQPQQVSLKFNPAAKCPAYEVPADVLAEVKAKQRQDDQQIASLSTGVRAAAPIKTGRDGGMHPTFLAKLKPQEVREPDGTVRYMVDENAKKKLGSYVNPPIEIHPTEPDTTATATGCAEAEICSGCAQQHHHDGGGGIEAGPGPGAHIERVRRDVLQPVRIDASPRSGGCSATMRKPVSPPAAKAAAPTPTPKPAARPQPTTTVAAHPKPGAQPQEPEQTAPAPTPARQSAASGASLMNGAAPTVPTGSFDQRWGAMR